MPFQGYKFKFELHASHLNLSNVQQDIHFHDFTITIYFNRRSQDEELFCFEDVSSLVIQWLDQFQGKYLGDMELFREKDTTLETIGDIFYFELKDKMDCIGYSLLRLEIFENPVRTYSVSEKILDSRINELSALPYSGKIYNQISPPSQEETLENITDTTDTGKEEEDIKEEVQEEVKDIKEPNVDCGEINGRDNKNIIIKVIKLILCILILLAVSLTVMYVIKESGMYPRGSDTLCHVYRADLLLESVKNGNWYPLYDKSWYNGVEIMRYWAPLPLYVLAALQYIMKGVALDGYILFVGAIAFFSGCGWLLFGWKYNRLGFSLFIGIAWFFLPENMRVLIMDGNLPRALIDTVLPFLMFFVWKFLEEKRWSSIMPIMFLTCLIVFCHVGIAAMVLASILIYAIVHAIYRKSFILQTLLITGMIISFTIAGIWLVPSLKGGASSKGSAMNQVMQTFFQNGFKSLNPIIRMQGDLDVFYYGFSVFIICILGFLLGRKKTTPSFLAALIIFFCTTKSIYSIFVKLPFSQFLWMIRFIPVSLVFAMMSLFLWNNLKKWFLGLLCILIMIDILPSNKFIYVEKQYQIKDLMKAQYNQAEGMFLNQAKAVTHQRMTLLDLSKYGAFAPYYVSGIAPEVSYTFGAGWEGAATATNIVQVNTAVSSGNYLYLFDRSLELGDDTVLICIDCLKNKKDIDLVIEAGKRLGYKLMGQGPNSLLFHKDIGFSFGIVSKYKNIAIGGSSKEISLLFPDFKEGDSPNIEDYTMKELKQYKKIYLSGFTYKNRMKAENMLSELANAGIKIYVDMNKVPIDKKINRRELFGVSAQVISFQESYPELSYKGTQYRAREFCSDSDKVTQGGITWNTVYLDGIKKVDGNCNLDGTDLDFAGTAGNKNICFLGFNLLYHAQISKDSEIITLLKNIIEEDTNNVPEREIVPVDIKYQANKIVIKTAKDNVNTTLSFIDIFHSAQKIRKENNLLIVNKGTTTIYLKYPYFKEGITLSIAGIISMLIYLVLSHRCYYRSYKEKG